MTRKEQIKEYLLTIGNGEMNIPFDAGFECGVEWADRTMIKKACEWIHTAIYLDYEYGIEHRYATLEELLNDFRKAMKGGEQ